MTGPRPDLLLAPDLTKDARARVSGVARTSSPEVAARRGHELLDRILAGARSSPVTHVEDVKAMNGEWLVTGTSGVVLIVCGTGASMKQAQRQAYNRVKNVMIPYMYHRDDIGERWAEDSDRLHSWGYLREA